MILNHVVEFQAQMLGSKTKQVASYGRRGRRIVNVSEKQEDTSNSSTDRNRRHLFSHPSFITSADHSDDSDESMVQSFSPAKRQRKPMPRIYSPESTPDLPKKIRAASAQPVKKSPKLVKIGKVDVKMPNRQPLNTIQTNTPKSSPSTKTDRKKKSHTSLKKSVAAAAQPPSVVMDIVILDAEGRRLSQERRTSDPRVQMNTAATLPVAQVDQNFDHR